MIVYLVALSCVIGLAIGQLLFKLSAIRLNAAGQYLSWSAAGTLASAVVLYGITSIVWVWVLQRMELGRAYPFMALAFVLVPIGSYFAFGEQFSPRYFIGICLIMVGIAVAAGS